MKIGSIRMLRHFIAVSQTGNFHRAAKMQSLTQSALTKSIKQLEVGLGVLLFDRTTKGVNLTSFGQSLYVRAKRIEAECELIEREFSEMAAGHAGRLTIGAGSVWSSFFLPTVLSRLYQERPSAEFTVIRSSGARIVDQLERGEIDVGLGAIDTFSQNARTQAQDINCEPLSTIHTAFFAHEAHPLHAKNATGTVTPKDLSDYPSAMFRSDHELHSRVAAFFSMRGLTQPHPALISDSISGVMQTLKVSTMITCLPTQLSEIASSFGVRPIGLDVSPWTFSSGIIYRKPFAEYPLLRSLIEALRHESGLAAPFGSCPPDPQC